MIRGLAGRIVVPVGSMRPRTASSVGRAEARLEMACTWGAGHLLVTGEDRADALDLLERVLRRIDPLATVRARACNPDPDAALDGLVALSDGDGPIPSDRRERRQALLRLLARARSARRSVFIVVDDGDDATVAQLERLRTGVEVAPEAIERLRLVFLGGGALLAKLDHRSARALRSRITSRIRVDTRRADTAPTEMPVPRAVAMAVGALFALLAYGAVNLAFTPAAERVETSIVDARSVSTRSDTPDAPTPVVYVRTGLRGDEPFIGGSLRIPMTQPDSPAPKHAAPVVAIAKPPAPLRVAAELAAGSSIAALVARFN